MPIVEQCNGKINNLGYCEKCHHVSQTTGGLCTQFYEIPLPESSSPLLKDIVQEIKKECTHDRYFRAGHGLCADCPCKSLKEADKSYLRYTAKLKQIGEGSESYWKKLAKAAEAVIEVSDDPYLSSYDSYNTWQQLKSSIGEETEGQDELWDEVSKLLYQNGFHKPVAISRLKSIYTLIKKK